MHVAERPLRPGQPVDQLGHRPVLHLLKRDLREGGSNHALRLALKGPHRLAGLRQHGLHRFRGTEAGALQDVLRQVFHHPAGQAQVVHARRRNYRYRADRARVIRHPAQLQAVILVPGQRPPDEAVRTNLGRVDVAEPANQGMQLFVSEAYRRVGGVSWLVKPLASMICSASRAGMPAFPLAIVS